MIFALVLSLVASFGFCLLYTPLACRIARRFGLMDEPDRQRKLHTHAVPLAGGIGILAAICSAVIVATGFSDDLAFQLTSAKSPWLGLLGASLVIAFVGVLDDRFNLRGRHKLAGQIVAVAIVVSSGCMIRNVDLFGWNIELGVFAIPFTAFWLLGAINSLNLIDGMDGMLGSIALVIALTIAVMACLNGLFAAAAVAFALAGALGGFLFFNLPPARVFLGDCGSMLIGLILGVLALQSAMKGPTTVMLSISVVLLTLPILDTAAAITRRTLTGRSIYTTDRGHLHHCLQRNGLSTRRVLLLVVGASLLTGIGVLASVALQRQMLAIATAVALTGILVVTRMFGAAELTLIRKRITSLLVRLRYAGVPGRTHQLHVQLQGTADWSDLWQTVTDTAEQFNLLTLRLDVSIPAIQERFHARWGRLASPADDTHVWRAEIPLANGDQCVGRLEIAGVRDRDPVWEKMSIWSKVALDVEQTAQALLESRRTVRAEPIHTPILAPELTMKSKTLAGLQLAGAK